MNLNFDLATQLEWLPVWLMLTLQKKRKTISLVYLNSNIQKPCNYMANMNDIKVHVLKAHNYIYASTIT